MMKYNVLYSLCGQSKYLLFVLLLKGGDELYTIDMQESPNLDELRLKLAPLLASHPTAQRPPRIHWATPAPQPA